MEKTQRSTVTHWVLHENTSVHRLLFEGSTVEVDVKSDLTEKNDAEFFTSVIIPGVTTCLYIYMYSPEGSRMPKVAHPVDQDTSQGTLNISHRVISRWIAGNIHLSTRVSTLKIHILLAGFSIGFRKTLGAVFTSTNNLCASTIPKDVDKWQFQPHKIITWSCDVSWSSGSDLWTCTGCN